VPLGAFILAVSLVTGSCGKPDVDVDVREFAMPVAPQAQPPDAPGHV
jgi:hypothetical protein